MEGSENRKIGERRGEEKKDFRASRETGITENLDRGKTDQKGRGLRDSQKKGNLPGLYKKKTEILLTELTSLRGGATENHMPRKHRIILHGEVQTGTGGDKIEDWEVQGEGL